MKEQCNKQLFSLIIMYLEIIGKCFMLILN